MKRPIYPWILLALLFVVYFVEQGSRQIYNAALPRIRLDFLASGVTDAGLGLVGTVFSVVFGLAVLGSGFATDRLGRRRVLVAGTLLFSFGILLSGFADGIAWLVVFYGIFNALGQSCIAPPSFALIARCHTATRSAAMAVFQSAVYLGVILSSLFAGGLAERGEGVWRWAFWGLGGFGILWAVVLRFGLPADAAEVEQKGETRVSARDAFAALLRKPTALLVAAAFGFFIYATLGIRLWMPMYLVRSFEGVGPAKAALHAVLWLNVGALASCLVTARICDRLAPRHPRIRVEVAALGLILCIAPILWVARATDFTSCCAALATLGVTIGIYEAANYPALFDCIAPRYRGSVTGLTGCWAFAFGSLAPVALGWMNETLSMRASLASLSLFYLIGALILLPAIFKYFNNDYEKGSLR